MISLPVCRWRQEVADGQYLCQSARYCFAPNMVAAQFCRKCNCADHEPPAPLPHALPCVHLGKLLRTNGCRQSAAADPQFACAIHGSCRTKPPDQHQPTDDRSCEACADYLARDPFGPDSHTMRNRAEEFLAAIPPYAAGRYHGRGIVIAGGGDRFFASLYITIRALRHVGCKLPIQIWYLGRKREMPKKRQAILASYQVECVDADIVRRRHPARHLEGWELKVYAALHSPFEELIFLDADSYPCRNPEFLFDQMDYQARGAIFWPDIPIIDDRLKWTAFGVSDPRRLGSIESGQFVINKRASWRPLNLAWFYNDHSDYYYRYCHGDKHTFEAAWARCAQPYVMWQQQAAWVDVAFVQAGPDRAPLFVHRCRDKFRLEDHSYVTPQTRTLPAYHSSLPMEDECWTWLTELAPLMGCKPPIRGAVEYSVPLRNSKSRPVQFVIATLHTPEIADFGELSYGIMKAYARRHGYQTLIARDTLDASRHPAWSKVLLVEQFLANHPECDWLMWIDADAVIANPRQRLEDLIDDDVDFLVAEDPIASPINTGVCFIRNCAAALEMLRLAYTKVEFLNNTCWEQPAVAKAMQECSSTLRSRIVSRRLFNSFFNEFHQGDFIIHFAGYNHALKMAGVKDAVESAKQQFKKRASTRRSQGCKNRK